MRYGHRADSTHDGPILSQQLAAGNKTVINQVEGLALDAARCTSAQHSIGAIVNKDVRELLASPHPNEDIPEP
jgi:hypothetical protein